MHILIWEFRVRDDSIRDFIAAYEAGGDWARLFRVAPGYQGTQLLRSASEPNRFLTIDRWDNSGSFEEFRQNFATAYTELDQRCELYTSSEKLVGAFTEP